MEASDECVICKQSTGTLPKATLTEKGSESINKASKERKDTIFCLPGQKVHQECCRKYCKPDQIAKALRTKEQQVMCMNTENKCLDQQKGNLILALTVSTVVNQQCLERREKVHRLLWSRQLKQRIQYWQYFMKEGMIRQMLCKQEFYMCMIYMLQMQYIIEYAVLIFVL